ncbi:MAG: NUDIX domain-containing protein [Treponema sp.]|jgi:8-oxo-dGTP pyrophosphatase MutT (NUDIX family)|nr:NUDIX domain-containing protein [Treponema sp.]
MDKNAIEFLIKAKKATYTGKGTQTDTSRPDLRDLQYSEGHLKYMENIYYRNKKNMMLFNEELYLNDINLLDFNNSKIILRNAVRAIILRENNILMVLLGKTNEYKFPGGGIEENEKIEEALKREVLEETGRNVIKIIKKIGVITEYRIAMEGKNNIFKMISEYYVVNIDNSQIDQKLDNYEKELLFKPCWTEIETAYKTNKKIIDDKNDSTPWIMRETRVLDIINKDIKLNGVRHYFA